MQLIMKATQLLMEAAEEGRTSISVFLIRSGADKSIQNIHGQIASDLADYQGHMETVKAIEKAKRSTQKNSNNRKVEPAPTKAKGLSGKELKTFMAAAENGQTKKIRKYIEEGVDVNTKDELGNTALMLASKWGRTGTVKLLIEGGASIHLKNSKGETAITIADNEGYRQVGKVLRRVSGSLVAEN